MSGQDTSEEKTLPPSAKKLVEARKKGQIAHSKEMVTAVVSLAAFGYLFIRLPSIFSFLEDGLLAVPDALALPLDQAVPAVAGRLGTDLLWSITPLIGLVVAAAVLGNVVVNGGLLSALDPVLPKMERLNPIDGFKRIFAVKSLIELLKSVLKLLVVGVLTALTLGQALQALVELPSCSLACAGPAFGGLMQRLILTVSAFFLILGGLDIGLQRWLFRREMRMTKTEQKRERKDSEGNPTIKRSRSRDRRIGGAKTGLRNATFVIRSADAALALRFAPSDAKVPVLVARGLQDGALPLIDEARTLGLPIVFDAEAAAAIATRLKIGDMIRQDMFQAVIACMHEAGIF
jgi:type III secretion protein U